MIIVDPSSILQKLRRTFTDYDFTPYSKNQDTLSFSERGWAWVHIKHKGTGCTIGKMIFNNLKQLPKYDHTKWYKGYCGYFQTHPEEFISEYREFLPIQMGYWFVCHRVLGFSHLLPKSFKLRDKKIKEIEKYRSKNPLPKKFNKKKGIWYQPHRKRIEISFYGFFMGLVDEEIQKDRIKHNEVYLDEINN